MIGALTGKKQTEEKMPEEPIAKRKHGSRMINPEDPVSQRGLGMRLSEWEKYQSMADELGLSSVNALAVWVLRDFIKRWDAGERPPTEQRSVLKID